MNTLLEARVFSDLGVGTFDPRPQHSLILLHYGQEITWSRSQKPPGAATQGHPPARLLRHPLLLRYNPCTQPSISGRRRCGAGRLLARKRGRRRLRLYGRLPSLLITIAFRARRVRTGIRRGTIGHLEMNQTRENTIAVCNGANKQA